MNPSRLIKLKELNGELENLTPEEKLFFQLHENLHENSNGELCNENNEWVVYYDFKNQYFWYNYTRFYSVFKEKFDINLQCINDLYTGILEEHLNCKRLIPAIGFTYLGVRLE